MAGITSLRYSINIYNGYRVFINILINRKYRIKFYNSGEF